MKLLMENWREYLNEDVSYVNITKLLPTEELGHGKDHDCPSKECEEKIKKKMKEIESGEFNPIEVCHQKPVSTYRLQGKKDHTPGEKSGVDEPFFFVLNGHHRLEAAKRLGITRIPIVRVQK